MNTGASNGGKKGQTRHMPFPLHFYKKSKCKKKEI
jgi:hypothetical protein